jgi:hypothetical protein
MKKKDIVYTVLVLIAFTAFVFVVSLYQFQAAHPFDIERIFSTQNIVVTVSAFAVAIVIVLIFWR